MKNLNKEIITSVILVLLLALILNPFDFWMPNMMHMMVLAIIVAAFGTFASLVLRERAIDERENVHRMFADRIAFLSGSTILVVGIFIQALDDNIDPWLIATLVVMVLAKTLALLYSQKNK